MKKLISIVILMYSIPAFSQVSVYFDLDTDNDSFEIKTLRFYISTVEIHYAGGTINKEPNSYHLIDFNEPNSQLLELDFPPAGIERIRFMIGIDSLTNVSGILDGDLDPINGMYWAWNTGYINFKVEGINKGKEFEYHIGGYLPPYQTAQSLDLNCTGPEIHLTVKMSHFLSTPITNRVTSVLVPGPEAVELSRMFQQSISISE